ncbi:hypothetical protein HF086_006295 [Spodoptera exigua]|uniref:Uncharacterized protein n=1 Tax=Spodoptera exigua TaxID=7107 RepID=A0A922M2R9_SPOEX|nr:hypothetical protein HF086_006295 [Spodoptera exigua]
MFYLHSVGGGQAARQLVVALREQALRARPRLPPPLLRALLALVRAGSLHAQPAPPIHDADPLAIVALLDRFHEASAVRDIVRAEGSGDPHRLDEEGTPREGLYPQLVVLAASGRAGGAGGGGGGALREALLQYEALLQAPPQL